VKRTGALLGLALLAGGPTGVVALPQPAAPDTLRALREHLSQCLTERTMAHAAMRAPAPGLGVTIRFALKRDGALLGEPRFSHHGVGDQTRRADLRAAVAAALTSCTPVRVTDGLGGAIAGRPLTFTITERRGQRVA
jgi:hypothetical protein